MRKIDNLSFIEAVERLADRVGIQLRYTDDGGARPEPGARTRMAEALRLAAEFFVGQLGIPDAVVARQFLTERGFDRWPRSGSGSGSLHGTAAPCCSICAAAGSVMWSWYRPDWHASLVGTSSRAE